MTQPATMATRLFYTSDWHIDARFGRLSRWLEFERFVSWLESEIVTQSIDWLLVSGDYFDPGRNDLLNSSRLVSVATRLHKACREGSIWLTGNHDVVGHSSGVTTLSPLQALERSVPNLYVATAPAVYELSEQVDRAVNVYAIPYPSGDRDAYNRGWADVLAHLKQTRDDGTSRTTRLTRIILAHHSITGAAMGTESREMARGSDHLLPVDDIRAALGIGTGQGIPDTIFLNGHYHKPQVARFSGVDVHIPGSPMRLDAGERNDGCEVVLIEID